MTAVHEESTSIVIGYRECLGIEGAPDRGNRPRVYEFLAARKGTQARLDRCCGSGKALIHAAGRIAAERPEAAVTIVGIDVVDQWARSLELE